MRIIITKKNSRKRLDLVVLENKGELTRSVVRKLIKNGVVTVNGETGHQSYKLKQRDVIDIDEDKLSRFLRENRDGLNEIKPRNLHLEIIYQDQDIIVCNKPVGINSHPVTKHDSKSVLNGLMYEVQKELVGATLPTGTLKGTSRQAPASHLPNDGRVKFSLRLTHRLDRDTSGVLMATKNLEAHAFYSKQFEERRVKKEYLAVVHGDFEEYLVRNRKTSVRIESFIDRERGEKRKFVNSKSGKGQRAVSLIYFEKHFNKFGKKKFSVVRVVPETGRTHQIRVHLFSIRFPILGDRLYGGQKYKRLMLHAWKLELRRFLRDSSRDMVSVSSTKEGDKKTFLHLEAEVPEKFDFG